MDMAGGLGAGALNVRQIAERGSQKTFADVAAAGIASAEDEDGGFGIGVHLCQFVVEISEAFS
jgi:ubiquinone/menaquinone biosynthesis C-methylase UbiE